MGQLVAFVSGKGGTGKTSLCAAIACCLAAEGSRVLCIDGDLGLRNLDLSLGMSELSAIPFTELLHEHYEVQSIPQHPDIPGLFLLTAPICESAAQLDPDALHRFFSRMRQSFDYCLIDAPAGIGAGFDLAVSDADQILVIAGSDPASLRDASSVAARLQPRTQSSTKLIVNRVVARLFGKMGTTVDQIMDQTGLPLLGLVPEDPNVLLAAAASKPLILFTGKKSALACLYIARRLRGLSVPLRKW